MKRLISIILLLLLPFLAFAQNEVSVVSFGTSTTEDNAVKVALRNAVERAFGTFVSANTVILNDKLISDEIATITRGNIKSFEVLSKSTHSNKVTVNVRAIVSIDNLISYAKSKGSSAEFAGNLYMNNVNLMKFRAKNTEDALKVLCNQVKILSADMFDYNVIIKDPQRIYSAAFYHKKYKYTPLFSNRGSNIEYFDFDTKIDGWLVPVVIEIKNNTTSSSIYNLIHSTITALKLSRDEAIICKNAGINCAQYEDGLILPVSKEFCRNIEKKLNSFYWSAATTNYKIIATSDEEQIYKWQILKNVKDISICRWFYKTRDFGYVERRESDYWLIPVNNNHPSNRKIVYIDNFLRPTLEFGEYQRENIGLVDGWHDFTRIDWRDDYHSTNFVYGPFRLPETKIEHKYSKEELKKKKKDMNKNPNYVDVPKYDIIYGEQSVIFKKTINIFFTENQLNKFSGVKIEEK